MRENIRKCFNAKLALMSMCYKTVENMIKLPETAHGSLGKGEVESSILSCSTIYLSELVANPAMTRRNRYLGYALRLSPVRHRRASSRSRRRVMAPALALADGWRSTALGGAP